MEIQTALSILEQESTQMSDMLCAKRVAIDILKQTFAPEFTELEEKRIENTELKTAYQESLDLLLVKEKEIELLTNEKNTLQEQVDIAQLSSANEEPLIP